MHKKLLITGVNGYIGLHMAIEGLKRGLIIRGTVRSKKKADECKNCLRNLVSEQQFANFEIVNANLTKPHSWDLAVQGCDAIFHTASPLSIDKRSERNQLIKTTREGVKHVFEASKRQGITRIVYTSSVAAVMFGYNSFKSHYSESDWSNTEGRLNTEYTVGKTLAEQDAWRYADNCDQLQLTTILPALVLGPINNHISLSNGLVCALMNGAFSKGVINRDFPIVDVRDIVTAHFKCLEQDKSIGERIILAAESLWMPDMVDLLLSENPQFKAVLNPRVMPNWQLKIMSLFNRPLRHLAMEANATRNLSNHKAQKLLGMEPRSSREALLATAKDLIRLGLVATPQNRPSEPM